VLQSHMLFNYIIFFRQKPITYSWNHEASHTQTTKLVI